MANIPFPAGTIAALLLLFVTIVVAPSVTGAEQLELGLCLQVDDESQALAALSQMPMPRGEPSRVVAPFSGRLTQSKVCCCVGFDGRECCANARSCDVTPPGCFCRPKK